MKPVRNYESQCYVDVETQIANCMATYGCSRLEAIARLDFGERSDAAKRALYKRSRRLKLIKAGFTVEEARAMVAIDCMN